MEDEKKPSQNDLNEVEVAKEKSSVKNKTAKKKTSGSKVEKKKKAPLAEDKNEAEEVVLENENSKQNGDEELIDAPSIDSLLYDSEEDTLPQDKYNGQNVSFDDFMADYKAVIQKSLAMARSSQQKEAGEPITEDIEDIPSLSEEAEEPVVSEDESVVDDKADKLEEESSFAEITISEEKNSSQLVLNIGDAPVEQEKKGDDSSDEHKYDPEKPRFIDTIFDFVELFIFTLAAVLIITTFFFKHTIVDGHSMNNTLYHGEHLIISDLFYTPERGDIIVFADYSAGQKTPYVKRVIGIPGDTVKVDAEGYVTVNGVELDEEYRFVDGTFPMGYLGKECVVPEGEVFVLGDHRNASSDSATFPQTTVKIDSILGKVLLRIYPFQDGKFGKVD